MQKLRNVDEKHHVLKNEVAQRLDKIEKFFRHAYKNETNRVN
jgi:hypothetical protein